MISDGGQAGRWRAVLAAFVAGACIVTTMGGGFSFLDDPQANGVLVRQLERAEMDALPPSPPLPKSPLVLPPAPTTTTPPPPPPPTTAAPAPPPAAASVPVGGGRFTFQPYAGLGAWLDVYDWSLTYTGGNPGAGLADIDRMASLGVRTIFIQATKWDAPEAVLEQDRLQEIIDRAHANGMRVVAWTLPTLEDTAIDMVRLMSVAAMNFDGLGVDIESRAVGDVNERNARLIQLSTSLRQALPGEVISAIVLPPVVMEEINPNYWPGFPWAQLAPLYDVWQPMAYWTNRRADSPWRDAWQYTAGNIDRIRANTGLPNAIVHPIGGIGDATTPDDVNRMVTAAHERGAIGGSLYDYRTTHDALWAPLQAFNQ